MLENKVLASGIVLKRAADRRFRQASGCLRSAVLLLLKVAQDLGIRQALGEDEDGKLALWQVIARCLDQGSRLSAVRLANSHGVETLLPLDRPFDVVSAGVLVNVEEFRGQVIWGRRCLPIGPPKRYPNPQETDL